MCSVSYRSLVLGEFDGFIAFGSVLYRFSGEVLGLLQRSSSCSILKGFGDATPLCFCLWDCMDIWFHYVLSPQPTPATLFLVKRCKWAVAEEQEKLEHIEAIWKHKFVNIFDNLGLPISVHMLILLPSGILLRKPQVQNLVIWFLGSLGINFRVEALLLNCTEEQGYWRLVGDGEAPFWEGPNDQTPIGMGIRYLAIAIVNKKQGVPIPFQ
ncbi:hypothetical protein Pint_34285 [Pistacia integerrima]|uniref:Uncharacterized protein n=1 Tax=Pistacia integerrima TaxID=434235 RepID=A0ACC0X5F5_9ROSI|nr:hypothetical protein Pint_34285 [Pistacia integerrima]